MVNGTYYLTSNLWQISYIPADMKSRVFVRSDASHHTAWHKHHSDYTQTRLVHGNSRHRVTVVDRKCVIWAVPSLGRIQSIIRLPPSPQRVLNSDVSEVRAASVIRAMMVGRHSIKNTAVHPRRFWGSYSQPWEQEISQWKYSLLSDVTPSCFIQSERKIQTSLTY
jgi:hypothetical protein